MVDIARKRNKRLRIFLQVLCIVLAVTALAAGSWFVSRLKPAAPQVERATVWIDTVRRGSMLRQVKGLGKLVVVPEEIRWVPAATEGCVEKKLMEPGAQVTASTVILELSNPQLEQETLNAEWELKAEKSSYVDLKVKLHREELIQIAEMAKLRSDYEQALLKYRSKLELDRDGLVSKLDLKQDEALVAQLANRLKIEEQRMDINKESIAAQLSQGQTRIDQRQTIYELKKSQLDQLKVRAGVAGVIQQIPVDVGQRVSMGTNLARVANPNKLKVELNVPETQVKDVQLGQEVSVDMHTGISIPGKVARIDPAVKDGTVLVDVKPDGELPKGARPDLSVDGTIVLERLENVLFVGRPVQGQPDSQMGLFKLHPDGINAERIMVKLGKISVNTIEIKEGLKSGDQVILSDMSNKDGFNAIRLN